MLQQLKVCLICLIISLSVVLLFIKFNITGDFFQLKTADIQDYEVEILIKKARTKINSELEHYDFKYTGVNQLNDFVMENGGQPLRTIVVSAHRSGSTFISCLLNSVPGSFFYNEPLRKLRYKLLRKPSQQVVNAIGNIKDLLQCDHRTYYKIHNVLPTVIRNSRLWVYCGQRQELYFDANFATKMCKVFPFQVMKLMRIRLKFLEELLQDEELKVKIILLVRDPRAVMRSRYVVVNRTYPGWVNSSTGTFGPDELCEDMISNYKAAAHLQRSYPDRFMALRFEDFTSNFQIYSQKLLKFLHLRETPQWREFLITHTNKSDSDVYTTYRVSKDVPYQWKKTLDFQHVKHIQTVCTEAMKLWGYRLADNVTQVQDDNFNPIQNYFIHL